MNIVFAIPSLGFGGAERVVSILASEFANKNRVTIILTSGKNNVVYKLHQNVEIYTLRNNTSNIKKWLEFRKQCKKLKADIVIAFMDAIGIIASIFLVFTNIPVICSERNDPSESSRKLNISYRILKNISTNLIKGYVFQSDGARAAYPIKCQKKSSIILNPIDSSCIPLRDDNTIKRRIVNVGRLHTQKNQKLLINAFAKSLFFKNGFTLHIYGSGPEKDNLMSMIMELNLENKVFLEGNQNDILEKIKNSSLFVLTSNYEGLPNSLMEAMAIGIPCISTDCSPGGARMLIKADESNGILVPCNDEEKLVEKLDILYSNPDLLNTIGKNAKKIINESDVKKIATEWKTFIEDVCSDR